MYNIIMLIVYGHIELHIPGARSLKDRRQVVQSLVNRLKNRFSLSVMEMDHQENWQRSALGFAAVCRSQLQAEQIRAAALKILDDADHSCVVLDFECETTDVLGPEGCR